MNVYRVTDYGRNPREIGIYHITKLPAVLRQAVQDALQAHEWTVGDIVITEAY